MVDRGLLDTSVVIDLDRIAVDRLPSQSAICAITLAELAAGPAAARDSAERARRQDRLQRVEAAFEPLEFGVNAARAYGRVYAAMISAGRSTRCRLADLPIASIALAENLPLFTRNAGDFHGLGELIEIISVPLNENR